MPTLLDGHAPGSSTGSLHPPRVKAITERASGVCRKEIMPDLLHLSPKGYQIWAESIEPAVAEALGPK